MYENYTEKYYELITDMNSYIIVQLTNGDIYYLQKTNVIPSTEL